MEQAPSSADRCTCQARTPARRGECCLQCFTGCKGLAPGGGRGGVDGAADEAHTAGREANRANQFAQITDSAGMSFAPDLSHSTFMKGLAHEVVEAMRLNGLAGAQISGTLKHLGTGLARRFGGGPVYVPRGRPCANEMADKAFKLQQQGASAPAIAKRFGVTVRWAQCLVKRGKERAAGRAPRNELE